MTLSQVFNMWAELNTELHKVATETIKEILAKVPNEAIDIDEDCPCCVSYDGGNHPEYASNCFSCVQRVFLKDGEIFLDIDDACNYEFQYINAEEAYNVAVSVKETFGNNYEDGE